MNAHNSMMFG